MTDDPGGTAKGIGSVLSAAPFWASWLSSWTIPTTGGRPRSTRSMSVSTKSCSAGASPAKSDGRIMALKPSRERAASVAWVAAEMHGADSVPSCVQIVAKFGDSAIFADGLLGGRTGCGAAIGVGGGASDSVQAGMRDDTTWAHHVARASSTVHGQPQFPHLVSPWGS